MDWSHLIRVEEEVQDNGEYRIRAELPGMELENINVWVDHGMLKIHAERTEEKTEKRRTEFRYGSLDREAMLPAGADEKKIHASYDKGILEITVPMTKQAKPERVIPIEVKK